MSETITASLTVSGGDTITVNLNTLARGPVGPAGEGGSGAITSATTSDGTANLSISNVTTATAEVTGTLTANHIHGNLAGSVYAHVRAGEALLKGDPVYVSGFNNGTSTAEVSKADASNAAKMPAIGIMDANLAHNATGHMVITGTITDVNTAGYTVNAELYVAAGGGMTATPPTARAQPVARVERVNANNGAIIVKVNGLSASDATASTLVRRDASGDASFGAINTSGLTVTGGTTFGGASLIQFDAVEYYYGTAAASAHRFALNGGAATGEALFTAASVAAANTILANNIVTKNADFTLAEADAGTYMRLTKTGSTQTITLPTSGISTGAEFQFYRSTSVSLAFSGGTVNGSANLASVPQNGAFALKHLGSGTYDFI